MNMLKRLFVVISISLFTHASFAQEEGLIDYEREYLFGANFNTNAGLIGGFMFRNAKYLGSYKFRTLGLELVNVRHPKELRYASNTTGNIFVAGKQNILISLRGQYGRNFILFGRSREDGVQVELTGSIGPTLGIVKPYYIYYEYGTNDVRTEQYDPDVHNDYNRINGNAGFFKGLAKSKIAPGINLKSGFIFLFGHDSANLTALETGGMIEIFPKEIVIIPISQNRMVFTSVYINIIYGFRR